MLLQKYLLNSQSLDTPVRNGFTAILYKIETSNSSAISPQVQASTNYKNTVTNGLSQQGVWVPFWTPKPLKTTPQDTQMSL